MERQLDKHFYSKRQAIRPLHVLIVGAGIGGLSAGLALSHYGHSVTIVESAPETSEVGAGLQMAPNATRILRRFGVLDDVMEHMTVLSGCSIRRYNSDEELTLSPLPTPSNKYGAPMGVIHRRDLHRILLRTAQENGCRILTSHTVIAAESTPCPRVSVYNGKIGRNAWLTGDLIIASDGIKSVCRKHIAFPNGEAYWDRPQPTGDAAYRLVIPRKRVQHEPELIAMMDRNVAMRYMGPGGHIMAYPLRKNQLYNMVLLHPAKASEDATEDIWTTIGDKREILRFYNSWSPLVQKWLSYAEEESTGTIPEWTLNTCAPLPTWVRGNMALLGDSCHPMLPYVAQGAANAIEDAAAIAVGLTCTSDVPLALAVYEAVRKERAEKIAASAADTGRSLHLPDGPEQEARDEAIRNAGQADKADKWRDEEWQDYLWGVDVMRQTVENWAELSAAVRLQPANSVAHL